MCFLSRLSVRLIHIDFITLVLFDVCKSVHHYANQIKQPTRCNIFTSLLLDVHMWLSMFWASPRPSSGAYNCTRSLWFYGKTRGFLCSCVLLMMGGETPNTCWATYKRRVINLWNCCILFVDLFQSNCSTTSSFLDSEFLTLATSYVLWQNIHVNVFFSSGHSSLRIRDIHYMPAKERSVMTSLRRLL